jgi:PHD/YefM family antitoxin component YafN of YafNO toxin-antitoxin module
MVSANDLKRRGLAALAEALEHEEDVVLTVRGKAKYVAMPIERYEELRTLELERAVAEAEADYREGRIVSESAREHFKRLGI